MLIKVPSSSIRNRRALDAVFHAWHYAAFNLIPVSASASSQWHQESFPTTRARATPPSCTSEALDPAGPWGALACGVEIKCCEDEEDKGMGAFATQPIHRGDVVGIYWGECLTLRQLAARHGSSYDWWLRDLRESDMAPLERVELEARKVRIEELIPLHATLGEPVGGAENGGNYVFALRDHPHRAKPHEVVCIDGEECVTGSRPLGLRSNRVACCLGSHASC